MEDERGPGLRQMRHFVVVAEELHFGRAAGRLGVAQPALSRTVRELEEELGVRLLDRSTRRVALTPAGEAFLRDARSALDAVAAAGRRARRAGQSEPSLRLALKADRDGGLLPAIIAAFERDTAVPRVDLVMGGFGDQARAVRDGRADVALLQTPYDGDGLDVEDLMTERWMIAMSATDPLARRPDLRLDDLAGRHLPGGTTLDPAELRPLLASPVLPPGARPAALEPASMDMSQVFKLVELGRVVCPLPESVTANHPYPGVAYRPLGDVPPLTLVVAWPQESRSPVVAAFVRTAAETAARLRDRAVPAR